MIAGVRGVRAKKNPVAIAVTGLGVLGGEGVIRTTQYFRGFETLRKFGGYFGGYLFKRFPLRR